MRCGDLFQALPLAAVGIKVGGGKPGFECALTGRPFMVEHGEPGGVAVEAFDDHVLAEYAFKCEAKAEGGHAAGVVFGVALPLIAAIAEVVKDVAGHEVHGLSGRSGALQARREHDVAYLGNSMGRLDAHETCPAGGGSSFNRHDGEEDGSSSLLPFPDGETEIRLGCIGAVGQPTP